MYVVGREQVFDIAVHNGQFLLDSHKVNEYLIARIRSSGRFGYLASGMGAWHDCQSSCVGRKEVIILWILGPVGVWTRWKDMKLPMCSLSCMYMDLPRSCTGFGCIDYSFGLGCVPSDGAGAL